MPSADFIPALFNRQPQAYAAVPCCDKYAYG